MQFVELKAHRFGSFVVAQEGSMMHGAFCWSRPQIVETLKLWSIHQNDTTNIQEALSQSFIPKTDPRPVVLVNGLPAKLILREYDVTEFVRASNPKAEEKLEKGSFSFTSKIPGIHAAGGILIFYVRPDGESCVMCVKSKEQAQWFFKLRWIQTADRIKVQDAIRDLPPNDSSSSDPIIVTGQIIERLIYLKHFQGIEPSS